MEKCLKYTKFAASFLPALFGLFQVSPAFAQRVSQVVSGANHNLVLREDGRLWAFGSNWAGQLGDGSKVDRSSPVPGLAERLKQVAGGQDHSIALTTDGRVLAWGRNDFCQIGSNFPTYTPLATPVAGLTRGVTQVAAGYTHSVAVDDQGSVWTWGGNSYGEQGAAGNASICAPSRVASLPSIRRVWTSARSTFALADDGSLWSWGDNNASSLGWSVGSQSSVPGRVQITERIQAAAGSQTGIPFNGAAVDLNGGVWLWGRNIDGAVRWDASVGATFGAPKRVLTISGASSVYLTARSLFVLTSGGELRQYTRTETGLSQSRFLTNVAVLAVGSTHFAYLATDGALYATGPNPNGQLGDAGLTNLLVPRKIPIAESVSGIAAGYGSGWAVTASGKLYAWGDGAPSPVLVSSGGYRDGCVSGDGSFMGITSSGGLNQFSRTTGATSLLADPVDAVACGHLHQLATVAGASPRLLSWGWNAAGQLGNGSILDAAAPTLVSAAPRLNSLAAGYNFSVGLDAGGQLFGWGGNYYGTFGNGSTASSLVPLASPTAGRFVKLAAGYGHVLAMDNSGALWAWGDNSFAALGLGTRQSTSFPKRLDTLPPVGGMAAGWSHSTAVSTAGVVYNWGSPPGSGTDGDALLPVRSVWLANIVRLAARYNHTFALASNGQVFGWGDNSDGQLGIAGPQGTTVPKQVLDPMLPANTRGAYPVVEYQNKQITGGRYFITAQSDEIKSIDGLGTAGGFSRTGRAWRAWQTPDAIPAGVPAKPVYRFYVPGPNSHFYTVSEVERDTLIAYNANLNPKVHQFEGAKFYALAPNTGANGINSCAAGSYPVYRAFNNKTSTNQGNHRITSNWIDIFRGVRFLGWKNEGVVFCSPISTINGGDLHAYHTYPGDSVAAGSKMTAECVFNNAGPGNANGATIYCALPPQASWTLTCTAQSGATCPPIGNPSINAVGTLTPDNIRLGIDTASFPAGGIITITATATAPDTSDVLLFASAIQQPSGAPDPVPTNNISSGLSKTVVKKVNDCIVSLSADSLSLTASNTRPNQLSLKAPTGCAWTLALDAPAVGMLSSTRLASGGGYTADQLKAGIINANRLSGTGDAILELRANANATANVNIGQITATATAAATGRANRTGTLTVVQAATPPITDAGCSTLLLNRESEWQGDNIISGSVSVLASTNSCTWTASSDAPWLIIMQGASSKGTGTVQYQIQANTTGSEQKGTLTIKGSNNSTPVTLTINQAAGTSNLVRAGGAEGGGGDGGGDGGGGGSGGGEGAGGGD